MAKIAVVATVTMVGESSVEIITEDWAGDPNFPACFKKIVPTKVVLKLKDTGLFELEGDCIVRFRRFADD
jgi:hypothetical protein